MASESDSVTGGSVNKWTGLVAASAGMFLGTLDITVNVALPEITRSFDTDVATIQWIIIFNVGSTTGLQLSLGSAADVYGLKRFYILGLVVYTLAVLLIGLAPSLGVVFGLRVLQALGNGLILASAPALVTRAFPPGERGRALGLMSGIATLGMITAALGGGVLVDSLGWRSIFLARVPLGLLATVLAVVVLRGRSSGAPRQPFDLRGGVAAFAFFARERDRGADTFANKFHQAFDHTFVRVNACAGQHFATVAGPGPTGNLFRAVAVFLVIRDGIIQGR